MEHNEYKRIVGGAKCAVLLIHGIVGTPNHFTDLLPLIPDSMSIWNLLLDGHGKQVRDFSHTSMKKWENQVADAVQELSLYHESIYIAAHSMGALLSIENAVKNPKIKSMFLLAVPLKLFIKPKMAINSFKVYRDRIDPTDDEGMASKRCYGIAPDKNPFHYIGWIPRYFELFAKIRKVRKNLLSFHTDCTSLQSQKDEMVSLKSEKFMKQNTNIRIVKLNHSGHYYYDKTDYGILIREFKKFLSGMQV